MTTNVSNPELPTSSSNSPLSGLRQARPYQREAYRAAIDCLDDHDHVHVVALPTGSGKTVVAALLVEWFLRQHPNGQALWVAPRWELLWQSWRTLVGWFPQLQDHIARIGGDHQRLHDLPERPATVYFTTLSTWFHRWKAKPPRRSPPRRPLLVIADESHWAQNARQGKCLRNHYLGRAAFIGLSATPHRHDNSRDRIAFQKSYADLCPRDSSRPRYLAQPRVLSVATGTTWDPIVRHGVITQSSLNDLADRQDRNSLIVHTAASGLARGDYSRILMFACNTKHADELCQRLRERGVLSEAVHSGRPETQRQQAIDAFRAGQIQALVTVTMLAVGLDVPEIDAVFLARPANSLVLLAQMIGRGSRLADGKALFWIVEFYDKPRRRLIRVFHAEDYLGDAVELVRRRTGRPRAPRQHHEPPGDPRFERILLPGLPELPYTAGQTFGVEIELRFSGGSTSLRNPEFRQAAQDVVRRLQGCASLPVDPEPRGYHGSRDETLWRVTSDSSCGIEVVSPILVGEEGFRELTTVCKHLTDHVRARPDLTIDHRCGLHLTLATRLTPGARLRGFLSRITRLEPGLYTLVAPSRLFGFDGRHYSRRGRNEYCRPVRERLRSAKPVALEFFLRRADRYHSINMTKARNEIQLIEIRMHHGTTDYRKIIPWISLWMTIYGHDRFRWREASVAERVLAGGNSWIRRDLAEREDIFRLLFDEGIVLEEGLDALLRRRRTELRRYWQQAVPTRVRAWERAGWYEEETVQVRRDSGSGCDSLVPQTVDGTPVGRA